MPNANIIILILKISQIQIRQDNPNASANVTKATVIVSTTVAK